MGLVIATIVSAALAALVARCAPDVGPTTMSAIIAYESGGRGTAIGDNTARRSYFPVDRSHAIALGRALLEAGHDIDVGYAQINVGNFRRYGLDIGRAFDPCTNVATGSSILRAAYAGAARTYGPGQRALRYALSAYNTGGYFAGSAYANGIFATAAALTYERPDLDRTRARRVRARALPFYPARAPRPQ
ncbi:MAG: hypothetical protein NVSMB59_04480 [Vulcanimicrobiaceae bacterium]